MSLLAHGRFAEYRRHGLLVDLLEVALGQRRLTGRLLPEVRGHVERGVFHDAYEAGVFAGDSLQDLQSLPEVFVF